MKRFSLTAIYAVPALTMTPASAIAAKAPPTEATAEAQDADAGAADKMICKREKTTASRLGVKKICMTRAEWERVRRDDQQATEKVQSARWKAE